MVGVKDSLALVLLFNGYLACAVPLARGIVSHSGHRPTWAVSEHGDHMLQHVASQDDIHPVERAQKYFPESNHAVPDTMWKATIAFACASAACAQNLVLCNDDGWAVASIRALYEVTTDAGFDVILSAPAENQSGTGSSSTTPTPLDEPCEYNSCPAGSPAEGYNSSDPHLNYVNAYPVDAMRYGIQTLAPQLFGGPPSLALSGPNIGNNLALTTLLSGTVGAACEAAKEGIPSAAFSGASGSEVSYTTLTSEPNATSTLAAYIYGTLSTTFAEAITSSGIAPLLPPNITLNVNYPAITDCASAADYHWVLSRIYWDPFATDVYTCGSSTLPTESSVMGISGCYASISVMDATTKGDVNSTVQQAVLHRLNRLPLSCLPSS